MGRLTHTTPSAELGDMAPAGYRIHWHVEGDATLRYGGRTLRPTRREAHVHLFTSGADRDAAYATANTSPRYFRFLEPIAILANGRWVRVAGSARTSDRNR